LGWDTKKKKEFWGCVFNMGWWPLCSPRLSIYLAAMLPCFMGLILTVSLFHSPLIESQVGDPLCLRSSPETLYVFSSSRPAFGGEVLSLGEGRHVLDPHTQLESLFSPWRCGSRSEIDNLYSISQSHKVPAKAHTVDNKLLFKHIIGVIIGLRLV
jgi:hypothetical protein